jgi:phosphatidylglycerophosphate synthase
MRDAVRLPGIISLTRLPLALAFPWTASRPGWALSLLMAAAASDVLDGWCARRRDEATPTGAVLDALMDKAFVLAVGATLLGRGALSVPGALLLATRDVAEIPLIVQLAIQKRLNEPRRSNRFGKIATVLQFAALAWIVSGAPGREPIIATAGACGATAAVVYWLRESRGRCAVPQGLRAQ